MHASSSAALRLCGSSALHLGQMQLVFKCGRVNEHKAKTSHHLAGFLELLLPMASTKVFLPTAKFIVAIERGGGGKIEGEAHTAYTLKNV